jgi:hypothetical protein
MIGFSVARPSISCCFPYGFAAAEPLWFRGPLRAAWSERRGDLSDCLRHHAGNNKSRHPSAPQGPQTKPPSRAAFAASSARSSVKRGARACGRPRRRALLPARWEEERGGRGWRQPPGGATTRNCICNDRKGAARRNRLRVFLLQYGGGVCDLHHTAKRNSLDHTKHCAKAVYESAGLQLAGCNGNLSSAAKPLDAAARLSHREA